jgi:hypothetical protein
MGRMKNLSYAGALLFTALAACSSTPSPGATGGSATTTTTGTGGPSSATVTGTLAGRTLSPAYAIALKGVDDASYPNQISIFIANQPNLCALAQSQASNPNTQKANMLDLILVLGETNASGPAVTPGTYTPSTMPDELTAGYTSLDANCMGADSEETAGSVTVTAAGASFAGTFDLTFGADHVTGSFDAPLCDLSLDGGSASDAGMVCQP